MSVSLSHSHRADCVGELVGVFVWYSPYQCARTLAGIPACANGLLHAILNRHWACGRCIYPGFKLVRVCVCVSTPRVCFSIRGGGCTQSNYMIRAEPSGHLCGRPLQSAKDRLLDLFSPSLLVCVKLDTIWLETTISDRRPPLLCFDSVSSAAKKGTNCDGTRQRERWR